MWVAGAKTYVYERQDEALYRNLLERIRRPTREAAVTVNQNQKVRVSIRTNLPDLRSVKQGWGIRAMVIRSLASTNYPVPG